MIDPILLCPVYLSIKWRDKYLFHEVTTKTIKLSQGYTARKWQNWDFGKVSELMYMLTQVIFTYVLSA